MRKLSAQNRRIADRQIARMKREFGDAELDARNAAFDRWYERQNRRAELIGRTALAIVVALIIAQLVLGWLMHGAQAVS